MACLHIFFYFMLTGGKRGGGWGDRSARLAAYTQAFAPRKRDRLTGRDCPKIDKKALFDEIRESFDLEVFCYGFVVVLFLTQYFANRAKCATLDELTLKNLIKWQK